MAEADTSPPWLASSMDEKSRGNEGSDKGGCFSRPSPSHSRASSPADTPRSTASGVVNLLESERRLLQNQAQSEMARKDEEIRHLRRALLVLSDEASEHAALQAEITACKAALERERESRVQGEIELERALTLLKDNVAQRVAEQEASERFTQDWQENFATAMKSEQHKATQEALRQQERRLREEMRELKEHARLLQSKSNELEETRRSLMTIRDENHTNKTNYDKRYAPIAPATIAATHTHQPVAFVFRLCSLTGYV